MLNQVFISYRHEGPEHARAVRRLGELLRQAEIPVALDQFYLDDHPGGPDQGGWVQWSEDCANDSACVLIIASDGWFEAYGGGGAASVGLGVAAEAALFRQDLWDEKGNNARIRLAFLHDVAAEKVPKRLRAWHKFRPFESGDELDALIRWVGSRLGLQDISLPTVRWPEPVEFQPDLADRTTEWPAVVDLLAGRSRERILLFQGASNLGKSALVRQTAAYARQLGVPVVWVDFKGGALDVSGILGQFDLDLSMHLPNFTREGANKAHLLRKDLRALRQPVLLIFDSYDKHVSENRLVADWLSQQLLVEVETALALGVVVAGQEAPDFERAVWRDLARHLPLSPITDPEHWEPWVARHYPDLQRKGAHLPTVLMIAEGNPGVVSSYCAAIARS
jgi:SEFIR domain